jgi:hypothetical protein
MVSGYPLPVRVFSTWKSNLHSPSLKEYEIFGFSMFDIHFVHVLICDVQRCAVRYTFVLIGSLANILSDFGAEIGNLSLMFETILGY